MNDNVPTIDACPRCGHVFASTSDERRDNAETGVVVIACLVTLWAFAFGANFWVGLALFVTIVTVGSAALRILRRKVSS